MQTVPVLLLLVSRLLLAQASPKPVAAAQGVVSGRWTVNADFYGVATYNPLTLEQQGEKLTGDFGGDKLEGTFSGNAIHFLAKDDEGGTEELQGTVQGGVMSGTIVFADAGKRRACRHAPVHGGARPAARRGTAAARSARTA
jgi:hypothetical protein